MLGPLAERSYRLFYNAFGLFSFLPVLAVVALLPGSEIYVLSGFLQIAALALQIFSAVAILLTIWKTGLGDFLGIKQLTNASSQHSNGLITDGPYRWVRHPLYTLGIIFIWATPILTTSVLALNLGLSLYIYVGSIFEERRLVDQFGSEYREYAAKIPRIFPRIRLG
jgi:protein-S-isoprenylcysteine O-methyltransferase Ste14